MGKGNARRGRHARKSGEEKQARPSFHVANLPAEVPAYDAATDPYCPISQSPSFRAHRRAILRRASVDVFNAKRMEAHRFQGNDIASDLLRPSRVPLDKVRNTIDNLEIPPNMAFRLSSHEGALKMPPISPMQRMSGAGRPRSAVKTIEVDLRGDLAAHPGGGPPSRGGSRSGRHTARSRPRSPPPLEHLLRSAEARDLHRPQRPTRRRSPRMRAASRRARRLALREEEEAERAGEATATILRLSVSLDRKLRASADASAATQAFQWARELAAGDMEAAERLVELGLTPGELGLLRELVGGGELASLVELARVAARGDPPPQHTAGGEGAEEAGAGAELRGEEDVAPRRPRTASTRVRGSPRGGFTIFPAGGDFAVGRGVGGSEGGGEEQAQRGEDEARKDRPVWRGEVAQKSTMSMRFRREASIRFREDIERAKQEHAAKTPGGAARSVSPPPASKSPRDACASTGSRRASPRERLVFSDSVPPQRPRSGSGDGTTAPAGTAAVHPAPPALTASIPAVEEELKSNEGGAAVVDEGGRPSGEAETPGQEVGGGDCGGANAGGADAVAAAAVGSAAAAGGGQRPDSEEAAGRVEANSQARAEAQTGARREAEGLAPTARGEKEGKGEESSPESQVVAQAEAPPEALPRAPAAEKQAEAVAEPEAQPEAQMEAEPEGKGGDEEA